MPKQVRNFKNVTPIVEDETTSEQKQFLKNRKYRFNEILGDVIAEEEIAKLVFSSVDYWDLDNLIRRGCEPELAIKILL